MSFKNYVRIEVVPDDCIGPLHAEDLSAERQRAYDSGEFCFVGVRVVVESNDGTSGVSRVLTTGGLWGIESDSGEDYFRSVAADEATALTALYPALRAEIDTAKAPIRWSPR
jgi:hypothetical protein